MNRRDNISACLRTTDSIGDTDLPIGTTRRVGFFLRNFNRRSSDGFSDFALDWAQDRVRQATAVVISESICPEFPDRVNDSWQQGIICY